MLSKGKILSALAGLALLALPVSAMAHGHDHDRDDFRPQAWNNHGWHRGWEHHDRHDGWRGGGWYSGPERRFDRWQDGRGYGYGGNYGYYPESWNGRATAYPGAGQSLPWLMAKRQQTMVTIANLRARGDSRGAARLVPTVTALNQRIGAVNRYGYNGGYAPGSYVAPPALGNSYGPVAYGSAPYNGRYGNGNYYAGNYGPYGTPYTGNPTVDALTSLAVPFLGGVR